MHLFHLLGLFQDFVHATVSQVEWSRACQPTSARRGRVKDRVELTSEVANGRDGAVREIAHGLVRND